MTQRCVALIALLLCLAACSAAFSTGSASPTDAKYLASIQRVEPENHLVYEGSDQQWHYFIHHHILRNDGYKVSRSELEMPATHAVGDFGGRGPDFLGGNFVVEPDRIPRYEEHQSVPLGPAAPDTVVGGDRDSHGCIPSAGYSWCERTAKCERSWESAEQQACSEQGRR